MNRRDGFPAHNTGIDSGSGAESPDFPAASIHRRSQRLGRSIVPPDLSPPIVDSGDRELCVRMGSGEAVPVHGTAVRDVRLDNRGGSGYRMGHRGAGSGASVSSPGVPDLLGSCAVGAGRASGGRSSGGREGREKGWATTRSPRSGIQTGIDVIISLVLPGAPSSRVRRLSSRLLFTKKMPLGKAADPARTIPGCTRIDVFLDTSRHRVLPSCGLSERSTKWQMVS